jgi:hypothetical protein
MASRYEYVKTRKIRTIKNVGRLLFLAQIVPGTINLDSQSDFHVIK